MSWVNSGASDSGQGHIARCQREIAFEGGCLERALAATQNIDCAIKTPTISLQVPIYRHSVPSSHAVRIELGGYVRSTSVVSVTTDKITRLSVTLQRVAPNGVYVNP
jgi:hypothetical protein